MSKAEWIRFVLIGMGAIVVVALSANERPAGMHAKVYEFRKDGGRRVLSASWDETVDRYGNRARVKRVFTGTKQDHLSVLSIEKIDGETILAVPELRIKQTIYRPASVMNAERERAKECQGVTDGTMLGVPTRAVVKGEQQASSIRTTTLYAPSLGCFTMLLRVEIFGTDASVAELTERETVGVTTANIRVDLEQTRDFREVKPSEMQFETAKYLEYADCPICRSEATRRDDANYERFRVRR